MKKIIGFGILLLVILLGCVTWIFFSKNIEIPIRQSLIEQKIKEKMPIQKNYSQLLEIEISDPKVNLNALNKRVGLAVTVKAQINRLSGEAKIWQGLVAGSSGLRYQADTGELYLTEFTLDKMDFQGVNEKHQVLLKKLVGQGLSEYFAKYPAYKLNEAQAKQAVAKKILKDIRVASDSLVIVLGR